MCCAFGYVASNVAVVVEFLLGRVDDKEGGDMKPGGGGASAAVSPRMLWRSVLVAGDLDRGISVWHG